MKGCFPTPDQCSSFSHVPSLLVAPSKTVLDACSISRPLLSLSNAVHAILLPHLLSGAAPAGICGTTAPSIVHLVSQLAQANAPRELGCAEQHPSHLGTPRIPEHVSPCRLRLLPPTCRPLGIVPCFQGLSPPSLLHRYLLMNVLKLVVPLLCNVKLAKLPSPLGELLATSQPDARTLLCPN